MERGRGERRIGEGEWDMGVGGWGSITSGIGDLPLVVVIGRFEGVVVGAGEYDKYSNRKKL